VICCSATIANPQEHAARIVGEAMEVVSNDGSPRGPKRFVLWNPPPLSDAAWGDNADWRVGGDRRSPLWEGVQLMTSLVKQGVQTIAFVRTRLAAELIFKNCRDLLRPVSPRLAEAVHAYRGGYLPEERRTSSAGWWRARSSAWRARMRWSWHRHRQPRSLVCSSAIRAPSPLWQQALRRRGRE
jgi:DEAD/DEAH box helicase domain-containing protein